MPDTRFGKYFTTEVLKVSPKFPGLWDVSSTRHLKGFGGGHLSVDCIFITHPFVMVSQPHTHEFPQYLHFISADPHDQRNFDAEIEMTLGEDATHGEKHVITRPTALYIPAGVFHGVDVARGVARSPGVKAPTAVARFITAAPRIAPAPDGK